MLLCRTTWSTADKYKVWDRDNGVAWSVSDGYVTTVATLRGYVHAQNKADYTIFVAQRDIAIQEMFLSVTHW